MGVTELAPRLRVLDRAVQRGARHAEEVGGRGHPGRRECRFEFDRRNRDGLGVDLDTGQWLSGICGFGCRHHGDSVAAACDGRHGVAVLGAGQRDDEFSPRQVRYRERRAAQASLTQGHRRAGQSRSFGVHGKGGHDTAGDIGQYRVEPTSAQYTRGQTDAAQQRNWGQRRTAFFENHDQLDRSVVAGVRGGEFGPAQIDDRLPQGAPALRIGDGLARGVGRALRT